MIERYRVQIGVVLIGALLLIVGSAQAGIVAVNNPSFESNVLANAQLQPPSPVGASGVAWAAGSPVTTRWVTTRRTTTLPTDSWAPAETGRPRVAMVRTSRGWLWTVANTICSNRYCL